MDDVLPLALGTKMLAGMLADFGRTEKRELGAVRPPGLVEPRRTSTYWSLAPQIHSHLPISPSDVNSKLKRTK